MNEKGRRNRKKANEMVKIKNWDVWHKEKQIKAKWMN